MPFFAWLETDLARIDENTGFYVSALRNARETASKRQLPQTTVQRVCGLCTWMKIALEIG